MDINKTWIKRSRFFLRFESSSVFNSQKASVASTNRTQVNYIEQYSYCSDHEPFAYRRIFVTTAIIMRNIHTWIHGTWHVTEVMHKWIELRRQAEEEEIKTTNHMHSLWLHIKSKWSLILLDTCFLHPRLLQFHIVRWSLQRWHLVGDMSVLILPMVWYHISKVQRHQQTIDKINSSWNWNLISQFYGGSFLEFKMLQA